MEASPNAPKTMSLDFQIPILALPRLTTGCARISILSFGDKLSPESVRYIYRMSSPEVHDTAERPERSKSCNFKF